MLHFIFLLALATCVLFCWDIHVRGSIYFYLFIYMVLVSTAYWFMFMSSSLIYVFIVCCLKSRIYFICLYFPHIRLRILFKCFRKYTGWFNWATVYSCNWWIVVRIEFVFMSIIVKRDFICKLWASSWVWSWIAKGGVC